MVVKNLLLRGLFGGWCIMLGLIFLKIHLNRVDDNFWGRVYRLGKRPEEMPIGNPISNHVYLFIGVVSLAAGLIGLLFGFRQGI